MPILRQGGAIETSPDEDGQDPVVITPPQGSEKWPIYSLIPKAYPLESLAAALTRDEESVSATQTLMNDLAQDPMTLHLYAQRLVQRYNASHLLIFIDQFEEIFTLSLDQERVKAFVDNLMTAAEMEGGPVYVMLTLRAGFYDRCAQFDNLRDALSHHQEFIGAMTPEELRRSIEEPARLGDWAFEPGLVDQIMRDVGKAPGALPLLSHALLETWKIGEGGC